MASSGSELVKLRTAAMNKLNESILDCRSRTAEMCLDQSLAKMAANSLLDDSSRITSTVFAPPLDISTQNFTRTNFNLLQDDDPAWRATDSLFIDFKQLISQYTGGYGVFELVQNFEQLCADQVDILQQILQRGVPGQIRFGRTVEMLRLMQNERNSWRLIRVLYEDRLDRQRRDMDHDDEASEQSPTPTSDSDVWNRLMKTNVLFREMRLVINWCENNANDSLDNDSKCSVFNDKTVQWENTLHRLSSKRVANVTKPMITKLDPDAVSRENKNIDDQDAADENRLLQFCFTYIRAGQLEKAVALCAHCGLAWRAATLQGGALFNDPNLRAKDGDVLTDIVGNPNRDLWKKMCWMMSDSVTCSALEKAIYGALCGNVFATLWLCKSWEDFLWSYSLAASEFLFDQNCRMYSNRQMVKMAPSYNDVVDYDFEKIFTEIEASDKEIVQNECAHPYHVLQKYVILNEPESAVRFFHNFISKDENVSKHVLRFMAHAVVVFKLCDLDFQDYLANGIIEAYVNFLIEERHGALVAAYVSLLPKEMQAVCYAKFLQDVEERSEDQRRCLDLASEAGLDLREICISTVRQIRMSLNLAADASVVDADEECLAALSDRFLTSSSVTTEDTKLVNSIRWLLFDPKLRGEALLEANCIARTFLVVNNVVAVKQLFDLMPNSVNVATAFWLSEKSDNEDSELNPDQQNCVHEYLCIQAYLEAHEAFVDWFEHFHRRKPVTPSSESVDENSSKSSFAVRAAFEHQLKEYESSLQRWEKLSAVFVERAKKDLYNVLLFPGGGWLRDVRENEIVTDEDRSEILRLIRCRCIPLIVHMLLSIFKSTQLYDEALQLADVVMSEERQLYKEFTAEQLKRLSTSFSHCSITALDQGFDFLGYEKN